MYISPVSRSSRPLQLAVPLLLGAAICCTSCQGAGMSQGGAVTSSQVPLQVDINSHVLLHGRVIFPDPTIRPPSPGPPLGTEPVCCVSLHTWHKGAGGKEAPQAGPSTTLCLHPDAETGSTPRSHAAGTPAGTHLSRPFALPVPTAAHGMGSVASVAHGASVPQQAAMVQLMGVVRCPGAGVALGVITHAVSCMQSSGACEAELDLDLPALLAAGSSSDSSSSSSDGSSGSSSEGHREDNSREATNELGLGPRGPGTRNPFAAGVLLLLQASDLANTTGGDLHTVLSVVGSGPSAAHEAGEAPTASTCGAPAAAEGLPGGHDSSISEVQTGSWVQALLSQRACGPEVSGEPGVCVSWVVLCAASLALGAALAWLLAAACRPWRGSAEHAGGVPGQLRRAEVTPAPLGASLSAGLNQLADQAQQQQRGGEQGQQWAVGAMAAGAGSAVGGNTSTAAGAVAHALRVSGNALMASVRASSHAAAAAGAGLLAGGNRTLRPHDELGKEGEGEGAGFWARDENGRLKRFSGLAAWRAAGGIDVAAGGAGGAAAAGAAAGAGAGLAPVIRDMY